MTPAGTVPPPGAPDPIGLLRSIWAVHHGLQKASKQMEAALGITGPQRFTLQLLGRHPGLTLGRLATVLHVHPATASGIVHRLERAGLVRCDRDPRDRRRAYLGLTAAGHRLDLQAQGLEVVVERVVSSLPADAVAQACAVLDRLADELVRASPNHSRGRRRSERSTPRTPAQCP